MPQKGDTSNESAFKHWMNDTLVKRISQHIRHHYPDFEAKRFESLAKKLPDLELKARTRLIANNLQAELPADFQKALKIILKASLDPQPKTSKLSGFDLWPFTEFIQLHGLEHPEKSLEALRELTQLFTAEFAVRPFLIKHPELSLQYLEKMAVHPVHHVRRWVSEGSRPRLPWGERLHFLIKDPRPTLKLLELLKYDDELYVRKSVANHLNDISKDHPALVIKTLARWKKEAPQGEALKIKWITRHALRSLIKAGDPGALKLIGVNTQMNFKLRDFELSKKTIRIGESISFQFELQSKEAGQAVIDYVVHFRKARGEAGKVFKLTQKELKPSQWLSVAKKHSFKPVTTRVYYPGTHHIEVLANGKSLGKWPFQVKV